MGAWGAGSFENDDAGDWVWELEEAEDTSILTEAFTRVTDGEDYVEAPDCSIAIVAAEVVAAMRQRMAGEPPAELTAYVTRIGAPPAPALVAAALRALERIRTKSELQELWEESDGGAEWREAVTDLEGRLK